MHTMTSAPRGVGVPRRLQDGDQVLGVQHRLRVEHARAPTRCDVGVDRHQGVGVLLGWVEAHGPTLPAE